MRSIDAIKDILDLINTHGLALIIAAIVVIFIIKFGNLGFDFVRERLHIQAHDELIDLRLKVSPEINRILERILLLTGASRAYVVEFHNSGANLGGLPFFKMSCTYEALGMGIPSELVRRCNMSLLLYSTFIQSLLTRDWIKLDVDKRSDLDSDLGYATLIERGIRMTVRVKIMDTSKKVIGYIGIDYAREQAAPPDDTAIARIVREGATEVGALLSIK